MTEQELNSGTETAKKERILATSLTNFIELSKAERCKKMVIKPGFSVTSREATTQDGRTAIMDKYVFSTEYSAESPRSRVIQFHERHRTVGGYPSTNEFQRGMPGDELLKAINIARGIMTADERFREINETLPDIDIEGPLSKMHRSNYVRIGSLALKHNITNFD